MRPISEMFDPHQASKLIKRLRGIVCVWPGLIMGACRRYVRTGAPPQHSTCVPETAAAY
jgi:hypothetical protein